MRRNGLSREQAQQRIDSQMSQEEKKEFADYLIDTSEGFESTRERTVAVFKELVQSVGKN
jgi:dephospho-CoA kinase